MKTDVTILLKETRNISIKNVETVIQKYSKKAITMFFQLFLGKYKWMDFLFT